MILRIVQVLNGLLSRDNQKEGISIPIGIIPAGSDNSLVWTVLGVRDPVSAAIAIVKVSFLFQAYYLSVWLFIHNLKISLSIDLQPISNIYFIVNLDSHKTM